MSKTLPEKKSELVPIVVNVYGIELNEEKVKGVSEGITTTVKTADLHQLDIRHPPPQPSSQKN